MIIKLRCSEMDFDELLYFLYMEEQERTKENRSQNENNSATEERPPKTE